MKYVLPFSCIFSACVLLSACQTPVSMNPLTSAPLTKSQGVQAGITFDKNEIAMAKLAKKRAKSYKVRRFATYLHNHYAADLHKKLRCVRKEHIHLEASNTTTDLQHRGTYEMDKLKQASNADFDKKFIHAVIKDHEGAIKYFDNAIQNETDPKVLARLKELRHQADVCLKKAQDVKKTLG